MSAPLRLTLRTLLSYLDDTLDPTQARVIGQKVAESEQARELMERIKEVTRRRRLTTPPTAGPGGIDPNTIAEYLDNEVTPEQSAEVEQICLASDVHLAEVAACHQILTLVLGEPALVPPSARQRMYGLVKGPEAIPFRKPPRARGNKDLDLSTSDANHDLDGRAGLAGWLHNAGSTNTLLLAGGGLLAVCLLVFALYQLFGNTARDDVNPRDNGAVVQGNDAKKDKDREDARKDKDQEERPNKSKEESPRDKEAVKPLPEKDAGKPKKDKDATKTGKEATKTDKDGGPKPAPVVEPAADDEIPFGPPELKPAILGRYQPNATAPDILVQRGAGDMAGWDRLAGKADIPSIRPLMSLPGMRSAIETKKGVHLTLWGTEPEIWPNFWLYESRVELYPHPVLDLDMTLKRGRIVLSNTRADGKPARVRVRFDNPTQKKEAFFDITLAGPDAAVAIDRVCDLPPDEPFYEDPMHANRHGPMVNLYCFFLAGKGSVRSGDVEGAVDARKQAQLLTWSSTEGLQLPVPAPPLDWASDKPKAAEPKARKQALDTALALSRNAQAKPLDVALQEAIEADPKTGAAAQRLALRCYVAQDNLTVPLEILDQEKADEGLRRVAIVSLRYWIAQERDNDYKLYEALREQYKNKNIARKILELLHGMSSADQNEAANWQRLIDDLDNSNIVLRALSSWNLNVLVQAGNKIPYAAAAPQADRRRAQAQWRALIRPGRLPPTPGPLPKKM